MFDYSVRKELEESWLLEMAINKTNAIGICEQISFQFLVHLCKCFLFYDTVWYKHWLKECGNFCIKCDDIRLKPNAKRPSEEFFKTYFMDELETANDALHFLNSAIMSCSEINREDATKDEAFRFVDFYTNLREEIADYLADDDTFDRSLYMEIIDNAIKEDYLDRDKNNEI